MRSGIVLQIAEKRVIPPYGKRQGFVPRSVEDHGDGGAFPEIHVAQYPLNMGEPLDVDTFFLSVRLWSPGGEGTVP
jgi:hypothetical protein